MPTLPASAPQTPIAAPQTVAARMVPAVVFALLGGALLDLAGFAASPSLHNAAHDTRHAVVFPCH